MVYECWAWVALDDRNYEWVQGFDTGTQRGITVFRPLVRVDDENGYAIGFYCEDWQLSYGKEKPTHKGSEHELIQQTLRSM